MGGVGFIMNKLISFIRQSPHEPVITGLYRADMALAYFPAGALERLLPRNMYLPPDSVMDEMYPTAKKIKGMHPFLLQAASGSKVHPIVHELDFRTYQEIMFYFPVIYKKGKEERLCSYVPLLYLEYLFGVIVGNIYFKFRKQYHPEMIIEETDKTRKYKMKDIIDLNFPKVSMNNRKELDPFFVQTFNNPTITVSYLNKPYFYHTDVFDITKMLDTSPVYEWHYKGAVIRNNENTFGNYSEFTFTLSKVMSYKDYFHPAD